MHVVSFVVKDLYKSLKILSAALVPWHNLKKPDENEGVKVEDLLFMVDSRLEEVENKKEVNLDTYMTFHFKVFLIKFLILFQIVNYLFTFFL